MKTRIIALGCLAALMSSAAHAGAFGVQMGDPIGKYHVIQTGGPGVYVVRDVPEPQPNAEYYAIFAPPKTGVCRIIEATVNNQNDPAGTAAKALFASYHAKLAAQYGRSKDVDVLAPGSALGGDKDWTQAVTRGHRVVHADWAAATGAKLPPDISIVHLEVVGMDEKANYLRLIVQFSNFPACQAELQAGIKPAQ